MPRQYKRVCELTIDDGSGNVRIIRNLRMSFEITKSVASYPNIARINIYNPNEDTLAAASQRFAKVTSLNAGYEGNVKFLFSGDIRNIFKTRAREDRIMTIFAGDGQRDWQNSTFNKTFTESVSIKAAVQEVLKSFKNLAVGVLDGVPEVSDKLRGQTFSGSSKDILDNLAREYGFQWSIQDGEVVAVADNAVIQPNEAILITSATGMLGSPTITEIGVDVTTQLDPEIAPNRLISIESVASEVALSNVFFRNVKKTDATGFYKVREVIFKGDTHEGEWSSTAKCMLL